MTKVVIAGIGQTAVQEQWDVSLRELAFKALEAAVRDAGGLRPQALFLSNVMAPILSRQSHLATLIADFAGLKGIEAVSVEAAGASGGAALRLGYMAVASGEVDVAVVVGVEKATDQTGGLVNSALATTLDGDYESEQGLTLTAQAALLMQRYLYTYNPPRQAFGGFPLTAHAHGAGNSFAMFQRAINEKVYQRAGMVCDPLNMFDVAPVADGAAAIVLTRSDLLPPPATHPLIQISGSSLVTDTLALHDRKDPLRMDAARLSVERAFNQAGITQSDVDLFELDDAFSITAVLCLESAGFAAPGEGWRLAQEGVLGINGSLPSMTMGGSKARGNPIGATGVYQAVEASLQLRGQAGQNQVNNARTALIQNWGGLGSTVMSAVLQTM